MFSIPRSRLPHLNPLHTRYPVTARLVTVQLCRRQLLQPRNLSTTVPISAAMEKIFTKDACPPAGPYTQAIKANGVLYVSGQIPADTNAKLIEGSIADKTAQCINNIKAILTEAGSSIEKVVKVEVFLTDMSDFAEMNGEYAKHFTHKPARSCVAVKQLPLGVPVEIQCTALA